MGGRRRGHSPRHTLRSLLFKGTNSCVFCDLEKSAKFKDRKIYAACASGAALYSMRTLRKHLICAIPPMQNIVTLTLRYTMMGIKPIPIMYVRLLSSSSL